MNKLPLAKRVLILNMLVEGSSLRSISGLADVSINTVTKLLVDAGETAIRTHDELVRGVKASRVQANEIWSISYGKQKDVTEPKAAMDAGDVWTWTALDADTKLIVTYAVGDRTLYCARLFIEDLAARISNRVELTTDGRRAYVQAAEKNFGAGIDFAPLQQIYPHSPNGPQTDQPDERHASSRHVERHNLLARMGNRHLTGLTNAFSKKIDNHLYTLALFFMHYNFVRQHGSLKGVSPAMAAGLSHKLWSMEDIAVRIDGDRAKPALGKRGL